MNKLEQRAQRRAELVRLAKDSNVNLLAEMYIRDHRIELEHLQDGDMVADHTPVGKDKFMSWLKDSIQRGFPTLHGLLENETMLKNFATQVADAVAKSDTTIQNPLKDYKVSKTPVYVKAQMTPAKPSVEPVYSTPNEQFRTHPDHPGAQLGRIRDKLYQSNIDGSFYTVDFEEGVKNQNSRHMNDMHPVKPFLSDDKERKMKHYDKKTHQSEEGGRPYDVFKENEDLITPSAPNNDPKTMEKSKTSKEADLLAKLTRKAEDKTCPACGMKDCPCMKSGKPCTCKPKEKEASVKTAQQFFGPTTMSTRQCPDHPGQQVTRVADKVYQCGLDNKVYDYQNGFVTEDGKKHNGGSVEAQNSIPPGSVVIRLDKKASVEEDQILSKIAKPLATAMDSRSTHAFLYQVLQHLPDGRERKILNYKFQNNIPLDEAIAKFDEAERLAAEQQKAAAAPQPQAALPK